MARFQDAFLLSGRPKLRLVLRFGAFWRARGLSSAVQSQCSDVGEVAELLLVVHSITHYKNIGNLESPIEGRQVDQPARRFVQQSTDAEARRLSLFQRLEKVIDGQAGIDDIFYQKDVASRDTLIEILGYANDSGLWLRGVSGDAHEVNRAGNRHRSKQIRGEDERAFQDSYNRKVFPFKLL